MEITIDKPKIFIINLNEHHSECSICGDLTTPKCGIPMYEDMVLPDDWSGEWFGQPACRRCFELQNKLTQPVYCGDLL
jgi:hypothetical protein